MEFSQSSEVANDFRQKDGEMFQHYGLLKTSCFHSFSYKTKAISMGLGLEGSRFLTHFSKKWPRLNKATSFEYVRFLPQNLPSDGKGLPTNATNVTNVIGGFHSPACSCMEGSHKHFLGSSLVKLAGFLRGGVP